MATATIGCKFCKAVIRTHHGYTDIMRTVSHAPGCPGRSMQIHEVETMIPLAENRSHLIKSSVAPTAAEFITINGKAVQLYTARYKNVSEGPFGGATLEKGDGYLVIAGKKVFLTAKQIEALKEML